MINVINEKDLFKINKFSNLKIDKRTINGTDIPIIIVDNLYVNPEIVREFSSTLPYTESKSILLNSPGKRVKLDLDIKHLQDFTFNLIGKKNQGYIKPQVIFNRMRSDEKLTEVQTRPHIDTTLNMSHALVIYLNKDEECKGGTSFYRHKKTGFDLIKKNKYLDEVYEYKPHTYEDFITDSNDDWELLELIDMKFNRMIIYPPNVFHSGYINRKDFKNYDRITQLGFF